MSAGRLSVDYPMRNVTRREGETARLRCEVSGDPLPRYRWLKDDRHITIPRRPGARFNSRPTPWGSRYAPLTHTHPTGQGTTSTPAPPPGAHGTPPSHTHTPHWPGARFNSRPTPWGSRYAPLTHTHPTGQGPLQLPPHPLRLTVRPPHIHTPHWPGALFNSRPTP